jgi:putative transposase
VKTIRSECLEHLVIFGERHLRHLIREFSGHYLTERYHQGFGSRIIMPTPSPSDVSAGLLKYHCREAA